jgi:hypothetical protein
MLVGSAGEDTILARKHLIAIQVERLPQLAFLHMDVTYNRTGTHEEER